MFQLNLNRSVRTDGSGIADAQPLFDAQMAAVDRFAAADSALSDIETELSEAKDALAEAQQRIAEAQAQYGPAVQNVDQAFEAWSRLSDQLDDLGIDEQYRIDDALSQYARDNYI